MRAMCHHHLIPHQFKWEKSLVDEIEKKKKKKGKREMEKEMKGRRKGKRKEPASFPPTNGTSTNEIHRTEKQSSSTRRQLSVGAKSKGFHRSSKR